TLALLAIIVLAVGVWQLASAFGGSGSGRAPTASAKKTKARDVSRTTASSTAGSAKGAINPKVPGLTTFRGNLTRTYYGEGPVPRSKPHVLWRYPRTGSMCARSSDENGTETWCGVGWTGQPNVIPHKKGKLIELRFGAYD